MGAATAGDDGRPGGVAHRSGPSHVISGGARELPVDAAGGSVGDPMSVLVRERPPDRMDRLLMRYPDGERISPQEGMARRTHLAWLADLLSALFRHIRSALHIGSRKAAR
ncbi:MAG: hypothetical protein GYA36_21150 [Veillonellaceae bacterium]|nr:hypothetical protein [Veillonellaceae bacterium]